MPENEKTIEEVKQNIQQEKPINKVDPINPLDAFLGKTEEMKLTASTGQVYSFRLKPLGIAYMPKFMKLSAIKDLTQASEEQLKNLCDLIVATLKKSLPKETTDEQINEFAMVQFNDILPAVIRVNAGVSEKQADKLKKNLEPKG